MDNIGFGLWMTGMGMSVVFGMLALLMGLLALMGRLDKKKVPAIEAVADHVILTQSGSPPLPDDPDGDPACGRMTNGEMSVDGGGDPDCVRMTTDGRMTSGMTASGPTPELLAAITTAVLTHVRVRRAEAAPEMRQVQPGSRLFASRWVAVGRAYQNKPWK